MDYGRLTEQLIDRCLGRGAEAAEVWLETGRNLSLEIRNGEVETVQESSSTGVGIRVFVANRMAFTHCNDLSRGALDEAMESAIEFAGHLTPDDANTLPDDPGQTAVEGLYDPQIATIPMEEKIELLRRVESLAMSRTGVTRSDGARYTEGEGEVFMANSHGLAKSYRSSGVGYGVSVVAEKGEQRSPGYESCNRRFFADLTAPEEVAAEAARRAVDMLDPRLVRTQRATVVFDPRVAGSLLGGLLGAINGERVLQGASFLAGRVGETIATELMTVVDDGTRARGLASAPFDGEGVPTQRRTIVDRGVLQGYMYNTIAAERSGTQSTGNASRGGFTSLPGIGSHAFYIEAGDTDPDEIVAGVESGLYLTGVTGYGINPVSGNFSGGAEGFWISRGRKTFPVKGITIASTAEEMFNGIEVIGTDLDLNRTTTAPTLRLRSMQIGGT